MTGKYRLASDVRVSEYDCDLRPNVVTGILRLLEHRRKASTISRMSSGVGECHIDAVLRSDDQRGCPSEHVTSELRPEIRLLAAFQSRLVPS
jgi:hypothetical protein